MRIAVEFTGRVQGVGFRVTAREAIASISSPERPLSGWVRNEADGSVHMELQGLPEDVEAGLSSVREAMGGRIAGMARRQVPDVEGERGFVIAR